MIKRISVLTFFLAVAIFSNSQIPPGYYDNAAGLTGTALRQALHQIIKDHQQESYDELWDDFELTDQKPNGKVWDMYSDVPGGTPPYQYTFFDDQCGNYNGEGDCYNREHSFPKSWFGGEVYPMYSDLFHVYPTDGYVNQKRDNDPYGEVNNPSWTSQNGSRSGACTFPGYSSNAFEPVDEYKGDFARTYFYMSVRYYGEDGGWPGSDMVNGSQLKPWAVNLLKNWHYDDPVSQKETDRNNAVYDIQNNRNPFIDHPEYFNLIWGTVGTFDNTYLTDFEIITEPNPANYYVRVWVSDEKKEIKTVALISVCGQAERITFVDNGENYLIDLSDVAPGFYTLCLTFSGQQVRYAKLVKR